MPIVDYNRIYHVQSRERKPVLNPVNVPDAAGAFIRAGVPAAGASLPGLRARLDDANARYRERVGRDRDRFRAIGDLIGVGKDVALAYAGAVERRDEADLNALEAAWQDHMAQGAEDAWRRPYKRGGENGSKPDGPLVAIRELDAAFDESDAMNGARPAVKQRFAEWRRRASQSYYTKGQRLQADAQDNFQQNALVAKWQASNDKIKTLYGLEDQDLWEAEVQNAIEGRIEDGRFQMGRKGLSFTAEQEAGLRDNLRQEYEVERANYWCAVAASSTEPTGGDEELGMAAMVARDLKDDAARLALEGRIEAARQQRERNVERLDTETQKRLVEAAADLVGKTEAADPSDVFKFADDATAAAMNIRDESKRATALKRIDGAVGIVEFGNWADRLAGVMDDFNNIGTSTDAATAQKELREVADVIGTMRSESGKAMAQQALAGAFKGRREDIGRKVSEVLERGWYFDREGGQWQPLTREQALDLFQNNIVFMDQDAREKARKALDKGRPRMTADSIAALNTFLGANQAQNLFDWDKVGSSEDGEMAYAPKDDWGKRGTIDIWNGRRDVDVDRAMAKKIWTIAERWQDLMRSGAVKPDSKGKFPTLDQYLDQQLKDDDEWRNWRDSTIAERVEKTMELLDTQVDSMFFETPNR